MADPLNSPEPQDPLDDPMLDALERSMGNPPGFEDPLAEQDAALTDDMGRMLDALEQHLEDNPPPGLSPAMGPDVGESDPMQNELGSPDMLPPATGDQPTESGNNTPDAFPTSPPQDLSGHGVTPRSGERRSTPSRGAGRGGHHTPPERRTRGRTGRTMAGKGPTMRFCPETRELIDERECESCDKYRHWPEGTNEEPKQCWYEWQASQQD